MFQAGFARVDITPPLGTPLAGYFKERYADGILDPVELNVLAIRDDRCLAVYVAGDIIYTRLDASDMQTSLNETTQTIIIAVAMALFLAAIMGYVFAQTLTGPILALTKGAKSLAEGDMSQSLKVRSTDEIGQLTSSFNYMAEELAKITPSLMLCSRISSRFFSREISDIFFASSSAM